MKKIKRCGCLLLCAWLLSMLLIGCGCAKQTEQRTVEVLSTSNELYVNDDANILSEETRQYVVSRVNALKQLCGGEIAVVTIDFLPMGLNSEEYAYELMNQWGVGDKERNNGVVLLLVPGEAKGWITAGTGIESDLTAGELEQILNRWLWEDFDRGEYDSAVRNTLDAVIGWYEDYYGITVGQNVNGYADEFGGGSAASADSNVKYEIGVYRMMKYLVVVIIVIVVISSLASGSRRRGGGGVVFFPFYHRRPRKPPMGGGFGSGPHDHRRPPNRPMSGSGDNRRAPNRPMSGQGSNRRPPSGFSGGSRGGFGGGSRGGGFGGGSGRGGGAGRR